MNDESEEQGQPIREDPTQGPASSQLAIPSDLLPTTLYVLPSTDRPFFPPQSLPLLMEEDPWLDTLQEVGDTAQRMLGLVLVDTDETNDLTRENFYRIGTAARVHNPVRGGGKMQFVAEGARRFRITRWLSETPPYLVQVDYPHEELGGEENERQAYAMAIINTIKELIPLNPLYSEELQFFLNRFTPHDPSPLADFAASLVTTAEKGDLQEVLEAFNVRRRMEKVLVLIKKELEVAKLQSQIRKQVEESMSEQQRKFFLREQLKAIQKELGIAKDDREADLERFRERLEDCDVPTHARERIDDEMQKLSVLESGSPEYSVTRNYLDWITALPWGKYSEDNLDLERARTVLDEDHDDLDDVKDRIIEFLAVGAMKGEIAGSILLLVGPPGVGKTSIGQSIARALGREFYRFSLGGIRDEAEIKGHRRTYIGAMPGKFIQAIKESGVANPLIMLDEVDKVGKSFLGDPASALLEVLDPEQNDNFLDHYLDVRFDLSKVLFVCTANQLDTIPAALLDRMEVLRLAGYVTEEKIKIAQHHLWPRLLERSGIKPSRLKISEAALRAIIEGYAREAGVRNLEKQLARIVRKAAVRLVKGETKSLNVGVQRVEEYLGKPVFRKERPLTGTGVVTGLAWTPMGGATLNVEATLVHTKNRGFKLTGQLGDVMRESAEIAYSYVSSNLRAFKGDPAFFDQAFVHVHVPEGATPKDGPSAGVTMAAALLSLARNQRVPRPVGMTGELTLTGRVYPVGGVREKLIAARRGKVNEVILPEGNRRDVEQLPEHVHEGLTIHFVERFRDVVKVLFDE